MPVDGLDRLGRKLKRDPLVLFRNEKALFLKVRVEPTLRLIIRVGYIVTRLRSLSGYLTNSRHNQLNLSPS